MKPRFTGRVALVTGAGAGFGRATAVALAREGARQVALVERYANRLDSVSSEIEACGAVPVPIEADLENAATAAMVVDEAVRAASGTLDILISNHVLMGREVDFLEGTDDAWERELAVNLTSHYVLGRNAARAMRGSRGASITFTASIDALGAERGFAGYCVTKAGLVALSRVMAVELAQFGIRVNCVSPGPADTQGSTDLMGEKQMAHLRESGVAGVPLSRLAHVEDIAEAFLYLSSDAASYVTGHNLVVDGGLTAFAYQAPDDRQ